MTPKQAKFVAAYTDDSAKTLGNATQSAMVAYPNMSIESASTQGSRLLQKADIRQSIQEILEEENAGYKVRLRSIIATALGHGTVQTRTVHPDGSETVVHKDIPHSQRLKAHELLLTLTGERDIARAKANVASKEIERLGKQLLRDSSTVYEKVANRVEHGLGGDDDDSITIPSPPNIQSENKNDPPETDVDDVITDDEGEEL